MFQPSTQCLGIQPLYEIRDLFQEEFKSLWKLFFLRVIVMAGSCKNLHM